MLLDLSLQSMKRVRLNPGGNLSNRLSKRFAAIKPLRSIVAERTYSVMLPQPTSKLLSLAPEKVEQIIKQVSSRRDLPNASLACKTLDEHAARELFKDVLISPWEEHIETWNNISRDHMIRYIPRHAIVHTQSDIENRGLGEHRESDAIVDDFESVLAALSKFPNLDSLTIKFTPECVGRDKGWWQEVDEEPDQREGTLSQIFQAIKDRAEDPQNRTIRKLTIINLQNYPFAFTSSTLFREVMSNLDELHISITHEHNHHGPSGDSGKIELREFPSYFVSNWLQPVSANLKALSIYHGFECWGPFPGYFDPSGLSFPKLEALALGYYTLAHDYDINWILAIKSLRKLVLQNCMIASRMRFERENLDLWLPPKHDWTAVPNEVDTGDEEFRYVGKWSQYFDRIAEALPNLSDFAFDKGYIPTYGDGKPYSREHRVSAYGNGRYYRDGQPYGVEHRDSCGVRVFPQRYVFFDNGTLPTHWPEAEDDGEMEWDYDDGYHDDDDDYRPPNLHEENLEADRRSLDKLLQGLKSSSS
jgi:hypothetical protein